jgi:predicted membrane protein
MSTVLSTSSPADIQSKPVLIKPQPYAGQLVIWALGGAVLVGIGFLLVGASSRAPNQGIKDQASALVLITAAAVAIERILEIFWTFVDGTSNSFWPLNAIDKTINDLVNAITGATEGPLNQFKAALQRAKQAATDADKWVDNAQAEFDALRQRIDQLKALAPGSDNAQLIARTASAGLQAISEKYPSIKADADAAAGAVGAISDFIGSLTDNPGRRLVSIFLGVLIGLGVSGVIGLDVFAATIGTSTDAKDLFKWGVALTGVIMGIGSNPTHEVIKVLQTYKQSQKAK